MSVFSSATIYIYKIDAIQFIVINLRKTYFFFVFHQECLYVLIMVVFDSSNFSDL